jgi:hypothetical protein
LTPIKTLAMRFPQLYVAPATDAQEAHRLASGRGIVPDDARLDHFVGSAEDELREVQTPAGPVEVLFLRERSDFETFLQIIGHKSQPVPIAPSIGAITFRGMPDWGKVGAAYRAFREHEGPDADWGSEFRSLASKGAFRGELVVISEGPYSNVPAAKTPYDDEEWLRISREIRLNHECAHVVCRRTMPEAILPVWDEITADVVGILCATDRYDSSLASTFLDERLVEYLTSDQRERMDGILAEVRSSLSNIEKMTHSRCIGRSQAFDFLLDLKRSPLVRY